MIGHRLYRRLAKGPATSFVLMYHRVAEEPVDPWELCVAPPIFSRQLEWLDKNYKIIPLVELVHHWEKGRLPERCVALTFDDGYLDNYDAAVPLLEAKGIPATFFITGERKSYWWDDLQKILLASPLQKNMLAAIIDGAPFEFSLEGEEMVDEQLRKKLRAWKGTSIPATKRATLYVRLLEVMRRMEQEERSVILESVKSLYATPVATPPLMQDEMITQLANNPLFTVGCHTVSHAQLDAWPRGVQEREIAGNKKALEVLTGKPVNCMAYPYGSYNSDTVGVAKELGFNACVTTKHYSLRYAPSRFEIGRYNVPNVERIPFL